VLHFGGACLAWFAQAAYAEPLAVDPKWVQQRCMVRSISTEQFKACVQKLVEELPKLDPSKRELFGERYDPEEYVHCRLKLARNQTDCEPYILRRREWREYWPEKAVRPKWPEAPKESVYRKGMKPREYWEALCKAEAGEFVFKTADNVKSVYNVRPRGVATDYELSDRYVLEDPFTYTDVQRSHKPEEYFVQPYLGSYLAYEIRDPDATTRFLRYFRSDKPTGPPYQTGFEGRWVRVPYLVDKVLVDSVSSRHGITWRGITRPRDREYGIAGGEFLIVDLATGDILGIRRGFALSGSVPNKATGFWWMSAERCPTYSGSAPNMAFVRRVLRPIADVNAGIKPLGQ
jgi:hypothetical protein